MSTAESGGQRALMVLPTAVGIAVVLAVVGEWITITSAGYLRADILVLLVLFAEARRWLVPVSAVVAATITAIVLDPGDSRSLLRLSVAVAIALAGAWVLRRAGVSQDSSPSSRFAIAVSLLLLICAVGALAQMVTILGPVEAIDAGDFWVRFFRRFIPIAAATMLGAAIWSRSITDDRPRWLDRLSLGFIIVGITLVVPYLTTTYWATQEQDTLAAAAATASSAFDAGLGDDLDAYLARASQPPRSPFVNQSGFAAVNQPIMLGNGSVSALALLLPDADGGFRMAYEIDRLGTTPALAEVLGASASDTQKVQTSLNVGAPILLGVREVPGADGQPAPSLIYVSPQATTTAGTVEVLASAMSIPVNMVDAIRTVGPDAGNIHFAINDAGQPPPGEAPLSLQFGPAARDGAVPVSAPEPIGFGDRPVIVTATAADGLGIPRLQKSITLLAEIAVGLIGLLLFLTAANSRFRIQRSLEQREALLGAAIEAAPGLVLLINRSGRVVMANSQSNEESLVGRDVLSSMPFTVAGDDVARITGLVNSALAGSPATMECVDSASGSTVHIHEVAATPVPSREDVSAAALVQVLDVTESRRAAMRDAQSERLEALGAMAGGLAHDFNNLLFIINGYLQLMHNDERIRGQADLERYVTHAGDAAERGAEIAKSLLSVTRSQPLNASAVNVGTFLHGIVPLARQALGPDRVVDLRIGDGTLDVMVDPGQMSSSVLNLVINARDATSAGGSVLLAADRRRLDEGQRGLPAGDYVEVQVTDDGEGMPPAVVERAFEPFFSTKPVGQGSGLGLASVYSFARQSGGIADISSQVGKGTTVSILIPAVFGADAPVTNALERNRIARVLVVDDEHALAGLVAGWISDMGVEVRTADSMESALATAADFEPDTLLTDMNIGADVDGLDVAARITLAHPDISVVFMTGFSDRMQELQQRGMTTLPKPFGRNDLYRVLFPEHSARDEQPVGGEYGSDA